MTNDERADHAHQVAAGYASSIAEYDPSCDIRDLICDLLHLARREGLDPIHELEAGLNHFLCEEADPPDGMEALFRTNVSFERIE